MLQVARYNTHAGQIFAVSAAHKFSLGMTKRKLPSLFINPVDLDLSRSSQDAPEATCNDCQHDLLLHDPMIQDFDKLCRTQQPKFMHTRL